MKIFSELKKVAEILEIYSGNWAVCGGIAASVYRRSPRFTNDIDIALTNTREIAAEEIAARVIQEMGYEEIPGFIPDPKKESGQIKALICCRSSDDERFVGIDFLLPVLAWIPQAVETAQKNKLDFGFACLPTITPEDLILSKLEALTSTNTRPYDQDDIIKIMEDQKIDFDYLLLKIEERQIVVAESLLTKLGKRGR